MANVWKQLPVAAKSALIAASVAIGILVGRVVGECLSERGVCSFNDPTLWLYGAVAFLGGWLVLATAMWALERDRRKRQQ